MMLELIKRYCPNCRVAKRFIRVIEAHITTESIPAHAPTGPINLRQWVTKTELPLRYCVDCKTVIFIGPSVEEIEKKFAENNK